MARILLGAGLAFLAGCSTAITFYNDAGYLPVGGTSTGSATYSGAVTGTAPISALAQYSNVVEPNLGGNPGLSFFVGTTFDTSFYCLGVLPGRVLEARSYGQASVSNLSCSYAGTGPNNSQIFWETITAFELTVTSPGPTLAAYDWNYPTGSLTVTLAPLALQPSAVDAGNVTVDVRFAPPAG